MNNVNECVVFLDKIINSGEYKILKYTAFNTGTLEDLIVVFADWEKDAVMTKGMDNQFEIRINKNKLKLNKRYFFEFYYKEKLVYVNRIIVHSYWEPDRMNLDRIKDFEIDNLEILGTIHEIMGGENNV